MTLVLTNDSQQCCTAGALHLHDLFPRTRLAAPGRSRPIHSRPSTTERLGSSCLTASLVHLKRPAPSRKPTAQRAGPRLTFLPLDGGSSLTPHTTCCLRGLGLAQISIPHDTTHIELRAQRGTGTSTATLTRACSGRHAATNAPVQPRPRHDGD
jgi:hypothetical protein